MVNEESKKVKDTGLKALFLELIGYEKGLLITVMDLYRNPLAVIESNSKGENKYVSGNRLLLTSLAVWVFFNSLILDWNTAFAKYLYDRSSLLGDKFPEKLVTKISNVVAEVMEKYIAPVTIVYVAIGTLIVSHLCKKFELTMKQHLEVMTYSTALYYMVMIVFSIIFSFNGLVAEGLAIILGVISLTGYKNYLELVRTRNYFKENGEEFETKYKIAKGLATVFLVIVSLTIIISYQLLWR